MNLSAYDNLIQKIDKKKTWLLVKRKQLITREIKFRKYNGIVYKYNDNTNVYDYYIVMSDTKDEVITWSNTESDDYGRIKIKLAAIWSAIGFDSYENDVNINIKLDNSQDDGEIYHIDV